MVEDGKVTGVLDENKRFSPVFDENDTKIIRAEHVLVAVGQTIDLGNLLTGTTVTINSNQTLIVDPVTFQSTDPDIFAGGDSVTGPKFAIDAIAIGKEGSISIHRYVQRGQSLVFGRNRKAFMCVGCGACTTR